MTTKFKKKRNIYLLVILLIALILRLWRLGLIPPGLTPDEAALGYNAYSILKTGKDEYGNFFPIIFKSFGDWKPGLYVYITIPFVAVFGLSESAVRLPSTLAGVIAIWLFYQIILILYSRQKNKVLLTNRLPLANINAFLLAISPWHILFSRGAWEVNMSLTLTLAGIYFFLRSLNKSNYLYLSSISFALTFLSYQGAKLSTFIVILILAVIYRKDIKNRFTSEKKIITGSFFFGLMLSLPILLSMFSGKTGRLKVFTITSYPRPKEYLQNFLSESGVKLGSTSYYLFYSESLNYTRGILSRWFNHFSSKFLFFEGD